MVLLRKMNDCVESDSRRLSACTFSVFSGVSVLAPPLNPSLCTLNPGNLLKNVNTRSQDTLDTQLLTNSNPHIEALSEGQAAVEEAP